MWCATPSARCWWSGTDGQARRGLAQPCYRSRVTAAVLPQPCKFGIFAAHHRRLDVTAHEPDVAQFTIVELAQRFDRRPAFEMGGQGKGALPGPADDSTERVLDRGLRGRRRDRAHFPSP